MKTPVLILIFNRPKETQKLLASLKKYKPEKLYIFSDGPRRFNKFDLKQNKKCKETNRKNKVVKKN